MIPLVTFLVFFDVVTSGVPSSSDYYTILTPTLVIFDIKYMIHAIDLNDNVHSIPDIFTF